jgi:hypothetical protein
MIEETVMNGICSFLRDQLQLSKRLSLSGTSAARLGAMLKGASRLADSIAKSGPADQRQTLIEIVESIEVQRDHVGIVLRSDALRPMIEIDEPKRQKSVQAEQLEPTFTLDLAVNFKRRGVEIKLIVTDERERPSAPDPHVITAVAQGRYWSVQIMGGEVKSVRKLAEYHGINQGDVSRILPLGFLAPDIVETILAGRQPADLTAKRLKRIRDLPVSWAEQRKVLGFT